MTVTNSQTGLTRSTQTLDSGDYSFVALPVGTYVLTIELQGFTTKRIEGITLTVGQVGTADAVLSIGGVSNVVTVVANQALVDTKVSELASTVDERSLHELPLQSRQFANLAEFTPGVSVVRAPDPTVSATRLLPAIAGSPRFTSYSLDNADNNEDLDGGILVTSSLDSIQEFQVITHGFSAEYGRAAFGVINAVTKSGANTLHGSGFEFFRNRSLNSRTHTEELNNSPKSSYQRNDFGGSFGGPLIKDRMFFFGAAEDLRQTTEVIVNTQGIDPALDGPLSLPLRIFQGTGKLDWKLSNANYLVVRYLREKNSAVNGASTRAAWSAQGRNINSYNSVALNLTSAWGTRVNDFVLSTGTWHNSLDPNSTSPSMVFPSGVSIGTGSSFPQSTDLKRWEFKDTLAFVGSAAGTHNMKVGFDYIRTPNPGGTFNTLKSPQYTFLGDSLSAPIGQIQYYIGNGAFAYPIWNRLGVFAQDDWAVTHNITVNAGLRLDYFGGLAFNQDYSATYLYLQTTLPGWAGKQLQNPKHDFGPRIGIAWDPKGDGRTVVRAGYGLYYNWPILWSFRTLLGDNPDPLRLGYFVQNPTGLTNPDGSLLKITDPLPPNQIQSTIALPTAVTDPNSVPPHYQHISVGFERAFTANTKVGVDFIYMRGADVSFSNSINRLQNGVRPYAAAGFNFPIRLEQSIGKHVYRALNVSFDRRFSESLTLRGWYTYSRCDSSQVSAPDVGAFSSSAQTFPIDENNPDGTYGPCQNSPDHQVFASAIVRLPGDFQLSAISRLWSGRRYNIIAGVDLNKDGVLNDLPADVANINAGVGPNFFQTDLRVSKFVGLPKGRVELLVEIYNVFNNLNPSGISGNQRSATYGQPTAFAGDPGQGEMRLVQLGARFTF